MTFEVVGDIACSSFGNRDDIEFSIRDLVATPQWSSAPPVSGTIDLTWIQALRADGQSTCLVLGEHLQQSIFGHPHMRSGEAFNAGGKLCGC